MPQHDIESDPKPFIGGSSLSGNTGRELLEVAMSHPIKLIANALGVPPDYMIDAGKERGIPVAALVGAKEHAVKQVAAGVDLIVAQGTEAGGHCGEVTTMVLIPEVIEAIDGGGARAGRGRHRDRQADGRSRRDGRRRRVDGIGVVDHRGGRDRAAHQAEVPGRDVARHHSFDGSNGKACAAIGVGLDGRVAAERRGPQDAAAAAAVDAVRAGASGASMCLPSQGHPGAQALATYFVGQGVGLMNKVKPAREVVREFIEDYLAATERLSNSLPD